jgi:hypothetical protein
MSQTGRKWRLRSSKLTKWSLFASCWSCFDGWMGVHYILFVKCSEESAWTSQHLKRKEMTSPFVEIDEMVVICELLILLLRSNGRAVHSARKMWWRERLNFEISQLGRKLRLRSSKSKKWSRFASCWACLDAETGVHCILHVRWCEKKA